MLKPLTPNEIIEIMSQMRSQFPAQDSLSRALDGDAAPAIMLARAARDAAHQEVLEAYEGLLAQETGIDPRAVEPEPTPEPEHMRRDFTSYLDEL